MGQFLIKAEDKHVFFIDNIVLTGDKEKLTDRISRDFEFVNSLNIHESFYYNKFKLVDAESVEFPDYKI